MAMYRDIGVTYWLSRAEANSRNTECARKDPDFTQEFTQEVALNKRQSALNATT